MPSPTRLGGGALLEGARGVAIAAAVLSLACESADAKSCRAQYMAVHAMVAAVDPDELESVEQALRAVEGTKTACSLAGLRDEIAQLDAVRTKLESSLDYLKKYGKPIQLTPEELAKLVKDGDPNCPAGQAYKPKGSEEQVRCTGPKLIDMGLAQAEAFFKRRGFKLTRGTDATKPTLKAEYGSESYSYEYAKPDDAAPRCVRVFAAPGMSWQESVARLTGVQPHRLKEGVPVKTARGALPLAHTKDEIQAIYCLGDCP